MEEENEIIFANSILSFKIGNQKNLIWNAKCQNLISKLRSFIYQRKRKYPPRIGKRKKGGVQITVSK